MVINTNSSSSRKMKTVNVNDRGQLVIPEEFRKDLGIKGATTLVMIEKEGELLLKKESEVLKTIEDEDRFWRGVSAAGMEEAWSKEDEVWEKFYKKASGK